jgi:hypothetical protein
VLYKRLHAGTFHLPVGKECAEPRVPVEADAFARLLEGVAREVKARIRRLH